MDRTTLNIRIKTPIYQALHSTSAATSTSKTKIIEKALSQYLEIDRGKATQQNEEDVTTDISRNPDLEEKVFQLEQKTEDLRQEVEKLKQQGDSSKENSESATSEPDPDTGNLAVSSKTQKTTRLNTAQLATRLGVSSTALRYQIKNNSDSFSQWTRELDPDGISWQFDQLGKRSRYSPVDQTDQQLFLSY